jgi:hypothetical protein
MLRDIGLCHEPYTQISAERLELPIHNFQMNLKSQKPNFQTANAISAPSPPRISPPIMGGFENWDLKIEDYLEIGEWVFITGRLRRKTP